MQIIINPENKGTGESNTSHGSIGSSPIPHETNMHCMLNLTLTEGFRADWAAPWAGGCYVLFAGHMMTFTPF